MSIVTSKTRCGRERAKMSSFRMHSILRYYQLKIQCCKMFHVAVGNHKAKPYTRYTNDKEKGT